MRHWYAFQSKTHKEKFLCEQLRIREIETFFPTIRSQTASSRVQRLKPYFPGYVFGNLDLEVSNQSIREWLPGAVRIVSFGGDPVSVPDHFINILRQHLETINASSLAVSKDYQQGEVITINTGPFAGYEGIFNARLPGRDRVEVLLKLLQGSQIRVELPIEQITSQKL